MMARKKGSGGLGQEGAFAEGEPVGEEGRILEPGADPEELFGFWFAAGGELGVFAGGDDCFADLAAAVAVAGDVLAGESDECPFEIVESVLPDAFDERGERDSGFEQGRAEGARGDIGELGDEPCSESLIDVHRALAFEPLDGLSFASLPAAYHCDKRRRPSGGRCNRR